MYVCSKGSISFEFKNFKKSFISFEGKLNLRLRTALCKKSIRKNNSIRKNKLTRNHILDLKMCFLVDLFFLIDFYMKRPQICTFFYFNL